MELIAVILLVLLVLFGKVGLYRQRDVVSSALSHGTGSVLSLVTVSTNCRDSPSVRSVSEK